MDHARRDFLGIELFERRDDRLDRALNVALDDERELLAASRLQLAHHIRQRSARRIAPRGGLLAPLPLAIFGEFARSRFGFDDVDAIAGFGRPGKAQNLDRHRGTGFLSRLALVVEKSAHAAPLRSADDEIAYLERTALDQHGRHRPAALVETRLDDGSFGWARRISLQIEQFGLQRDQIEQLVEIDVLGRRNFDLKRFAAERFDLHFMLQQFAAHSLWFGVRLVDLADRQDHRDLGGARMGDRFRSLRHDAIVRGDDENDDVRDLGAARAHRGECRVTGSVDERYLRTVRRDDLIGANVLRDAASLPGDDIGMTDRVEQRSLAMIDMTHDRHDRGARHKIFAGVRRIEEPFLDIGLGNPLHGVAEFLGDELRRVGIDHIGDFRHLALLHQKLDDIDATLRHAAGEFLDRYCLGQDHFARELFLGLVDMTLEPLNAAAERGNRPGALFFFPGDVGDRQAAAAFYPGAPDRAWNSGPHRHSRTANNVWDFLVLGRRRFWRRGKAGRSHRRGGGYLAQGRCRRRWSRFAPGEAPFGLVFRAAPGFRILRAPRLFLAFAGFGRGTLVTLASFAFFAGLGFDFGTLTLFHLAFTGPGKGARPGFAFFFRQ